MNEYQAFADAYRFRAAGRVFHDPVIARMAEVAYALAAEMTATDTVDATLDFSGFMAAFIPKLLANSAFWSGLSSRIDSDHAIQSEISNAIWPGLLQKMVLYFRANPPAAAPQPKNFFGF